MQTKRSLPMLALLFSMVALFLAPQISFAKKVVCKPKHYCYVASWGCMPCKYAKKAARLDKESKKTSSAVKTTQSNIKKLTSALAKLNRRLTKLKTKQKTQARSRRRIRKRTRSLPRRGPVNPGGHMRPFIPR